MQIIAVDGAKVSQDLPVKKKRQRAEKLLYTGDIRDPSIRTLSPDKLLEKLQEINGIYLSEDGRNHFYNGSFFPLSESFSLSQEANIWLNEDLRLVWTLFSGCAPAAQRMRLANIIESISNKYTNESYRECRGNLLTALRELHMSMQ